MISIHGREGDYLEVASVNDIYDARPIAVNDLTLSQFATSYKKCPIKPKRLRLETNGASEETGYIIDHITGEPLPRYIQMNTDSKEIYRLRRHSTVLRMHASYKKSGDEEYFAGN